RFDLYLLLGIIVVTLLICLFPTSQAHSAAAAPVSRGQAWGMGGAGSAQDAAQHSTSQASSMHLAPQASPTPPCMGTGCPYDPARDPCAHFGLINCNPDNPLSGSTCQNKVSCSTLLNQYCNMQQSTDVQQSTGAPLCDNNGIPNCTLQTYDSPCVESI